MNDESTEYEESTTEQFLQLANDLSMDSIALSSIHGDDSDAPESASKFAHIMNYVGIKLNKTNSSSFIIDQCNCSEL